MTRGVMLGLLVATLVALALRCPELGRRPMHNDEAVNAIKFRSLWEQGDYQYDPNDYHGPSLCYLTLAWTKLTRTTDFVQLDEAGLRGLTVFFGIGLILLLALVVDGLGRAATVWAGLFMAISPAMVFYSRDYIHEMLLVCFTLLALGSGWRYFRSGKIGWAVLAGAGAGLMQSTKETFVLALGAMAAALLLNGLWMRQVEATAGDVSFKFATRHVLAAIAAWLAVALLFFSSFFTHAGALLDVFKTFSPSLHRAAGESTHVHPWNFYLERLAFFHARNGPVWSEGLILGLALVGLFVAGTRKGARDSHPGFLRFLALYTLTLTTAYSLIPYKTPWCLLSFWEGTILLAGVGAAAVLQQVTGQWLRVFAGLLLLANAGVLASQAWLASVTCSADPKNPYVYAQTSPNVLELVDELEALARAHPQGHHLLVKVMAPGNDYWPLPWYLRAFDQVGWWNNLPPDPSAPLMIVSTKLKADLDTKGAHLLAGLFELRPGVFLELYVQSDLWQAYLDAKAGKQNAPEPGEHR